MNMNISVSLRNSNYPAQVAVNHLIFCPQVLCSPLFDGFRYFKIVFKHSMWSCSCQATNYRLYPWKVNVKIQWCKSSLQMNHKIKSMLLCLKWCASLQCAGTAPRSTVERSAPDCLDWSLLTHTAWLALHCWHWTLNSLPGLLGLVSRQQYRKISVLWKAVLLALFQNKILAIGLSGEQGFMAKGADWCEGMLFGMCCAVTEVFWKEPYLSLCGCAVW